MGDRVQKPGVAMRATAAFALLNLPLVGTVLFALWMAGGNEADWWIRGILALVVAVAEFAIVTTTIAPPLYDWIKSEEYVKDGAKPSWEK